MLKLDVIGFCFGDAIAMKEPSGSVWYERMDVERELDVVARNAHLL